jgi:phospholipid/cholesterol/gamma-HCH transport system substrate-binding protein
MNPPGPRLGGQRVELAVGAFLLLALATLLVLAFASTNRKFGLGGSAYRLTAKFGNIGELRVHAPVKIGGVIVGQVARIELDPKSYEAVVTLALQPAYKNLPADTTTKILTAGLLGDRYVSLDPGGDPETLPSGGELIYTQNAVVLEDLISRFIFGGGRKKDDVPTESTPGTDNSPPSAPSAPTEKQP